MTETKHLVDWRKTCSSAGRRGGKASTGLSLRPSSHLPLTFNVGKWEHVEILSTLSRLKGFSYLDQGICLYKICTSFVKKEKAFHFIPFAYELLPLPSISHLNNTELMRPGWDNQSHLVLKDGTWADYICPSNPLPLHPLCLPHPLPSHVHPDASLHPRGNRPVTGFRVRVGVHTQMNKENETIRSSAIKTDLYPSCTQSTGVCHPAMKPSENPNNADNPIYFTAKGETVVHTHVQMHTKVM